MIHSLNDKITVGLQTLLATSTAQLTSCTCMQKRYVHVHTKSNSKKVGLLKSIHAPTHLPIGSIVGLEVTSHNVIDDGYETTDDDKTVNDVEEASHVGTSMEYQSQGCDLSSVKLHFKTYLHVYLQ